MTRAEKVAKAQALRAKGWKLREIAVEMGYAVQTVHTWLSDPDLSKQRARREGYRGTCRECGARTAGSEGRANAPTLCNACNVQRFAEESRRWTRDLLIAALRRWAELYGGPPTATDWNPSQAERLGHPEKAVRWRADEWPVEGTIRAEFGTWNAGLVAAGFVPCAPGVYRYAERGRAA